MILEEIADYLEAEGLGQAGYADLPQTPDAAFAIWKYGGETGVFVRNKAEPVLEIVRFQVINRASSYVAAELKAEQIYRALNGFKGTLSGVAYSGIRALAPPNFLNRDDKTRPRMICNYEARKELSPIT